MIIQRKSERGIKMKKFVRIISLVTVLALACMIFASCGKKSDLASVEEEGKLIMLTNAAFPPFEYLGENGETIGVDVEIAQKIAERLGVELEVVDMDFNGIVAALASGKGHIAAAGMTVSEERLKSVDFSVNYVTSAQYMIVPADNTTILTSADLKDKVVGVQEGTTGDLYASGEWDGDFGVKQVLRFSNAVEASTALMNGKCDLVIVDELPAKLIVAQNESVLKLVDTPLTLEDYAIAMRKGSDLSKIINEELQKMIDDGTVEDLILKHTAVQ